MGQVKTSKYAYKTYGYAGFAETPSCWKGKLPTLAKLERHIMAGVVSTMPGFANEHIGKRYGIQIPSRVVIVENFLGGKVMVEWKAPMFQVLPDPADYPEVAKAFSMVAAK